MQQGTADRPSCVVPHLTLQDCGTRRLYLIANTNVILRTEAFGNADVALSGCTGHSTPRCAPPIIQVVVARGEVFVEIALRRAVAQLRHCQLNQEHAGAAGTALSSHRKAAVHVRYDTGVITVMEASAQNREAALWP